MSYNINTRIFAKLSLETPELRKEFLLDLSQALDQLMAGTLTLPPTGGNTVYLNGSGQWSTPPGSGGGGIPEAPTDGQEYVRQSATWVVNTPAWTAITGKPTNFPPSAHAPTHEAGGSDVIPIDALGPASNNTNLNASTSAHGLLPILNGSSSQFLNGTGAWSAPSVGAPPASLTDLGSPAGNSTINTGQAFLVAVNLVWTTAANWTLTLNNLLLGAVVYLRLLNSSGAARTFTILANTSTPTAYAVTLWVPGANPLTGAITVNNGNALNAHGVSFTVSGSPALQLQGFGSTG